MTTLEIVLVIGAVALLAITVFAIATAKTYKERHERLQKRFGSEYDRVLEQTGDERKADRRRAILPGSGGGEQPTRSVRAIQSRRG